MGYTVVGAKGREKDKEQRHEEKARPWQCLFWLPLVGDKVMKHRINLKKFALVSANRQVMIWIQSSV